MLHRPRRLRKNQSIRDLVAENHLACSDFVYPCFVIEGKQKKIAIDSMPGIYRFSKDLLLKECESILKLGIRAIAPFPVIPENLKDNVATESSNSEGLYPSTIRLIKEKLPELTVFSDVAMDPYSSDGHDGLVEDEEILNDETLPILSKMAIVQAEAGSDFIAPSDMMDGRVAYLRQSLDQAGYSNVGILSYAVKYASSFYSPFRHALDSAPKLGNKKTYQMNFTNSAEAIREVALDLEEGADIVMVKPGLSYLDVLKELKLTFQVPLALYNVSGEYAMLHAASKQGWLDYHATVTEILTSMKRSGADIIFTYHAKEFASWLN